MTPKQKVWAKWDNQYYKYYRQKHSNKFKYILKRKDLSCYQKVSSNQTWLISNEK